MTIEECYAQFNGDYKKILGTFRNEAIIKKFALKFLDDKSFEQLTQALENDDANAAFHAAHTLKGVSGNLAFTKLYDSACEITELLRTEQLAEAKEAYPNVKLQYDITFNALSRLM